MRALGFKKVGAFDRCELNDTAKYVRGTTELTVIMRLHPADYPDVGICLHLFDGDQLLLNRLYPLDDCTIDVLIDQICNDVESNQIAFP